MASEIEGQGNYSVLYMRVRKDLLERLGRGEWATGDRLPTEAQLAAEYGVSRNVYLWLRWRETEPGAHLRGPASTLSIPFPS